MVRPVSFKGFQKGFQGVSLRGFRGFQFFLWELCVCIKYLSLGDIAVCQRIFRILGINNHFPNRRFSRSPCLPQFLRNNILVTHTKTAWLIEAVFRLFQFLLRHADLQRQVSRMNCRTVLVQVVVYAAVRIYIINNLT